MNLLTAWLLSRTASAADEGTFWMPPQASTVAADVDFTYYFIYWVDVIFFVLLMGAMIYFAIRYRQRKEGEKTNPIKGSHTIELVWSVFPSFLLIAMFVLGFQAYMKEVIPPADAMEVRVTAQKWRWSFDYPDYGITNSPVLVAPRGKPVRLTMSSKDVIHSFYVPDFRIKKDVVPGRYTSLWFQVDEIFPERPSSGRGPNDDGELVSGLGAGEHQVFCTEYCGTDHSRMYSRVRIVEPEAFESWAAAQSKPADCANAAECGKGIYKKVGCAACHSIDGSRLVGPSFAKIWGKDEALADGSSVKVDDNYIRESITVPGEKIVEGYAPQMPSYQGQLSDEDINNLIEFIKSLQ